MEILESRSFSNSFHRTRNRLIDPYGSISFASLPGF